MRLRRRSRAVLAVVVSCTWFISIATPAAADEGAQRGPAQVGTEELARDSWIIRLVPGADAAREAAGLSRAAGGIAGPTYRHAFPGFQFLGSAEAAAALARSPRVASVTADSALYLTDSLPLGAERIASWEPGGTEGAYQQGFRGNGARIAVLDTGLDVDHPDLVGNIDQGLGLNCLTEGAVPNDGYGHGSHVAGTAAAPYNGIGVVGVAPEARLVAIKMFDDAGNSSEARALCALDHVIGLNTDADPSNDVDVANMSWGESRSWGACGTGTDPLHDAICAADAAGIILVAGSGNSAVDGGTFVPAAYPEVISVSAWTDLNGEPGAGSGCAFVNDIFWYECDETFALFSNHGASIDVMAPGVQIYSTWAGAGYRNSSGTSMATPHVAGVAALMAAAAPGLTPGAALAALLESGECPNDQRADADGTAGCAGQGTWTEDPDGIAEPLVNALWAAQAAANQEPPDPAEPPSAPSLSAAATESSIELSWSAPVDDGGAAITGYQVYRGASAGNATPYATLGPVQGYSDTAVAPGETWWYEVAAVNTAGIGARSNEVSATVPLPPPPDPPSAPALAASAGDGTVSLEWVAPSDDGGATVTNYEIYRGTSSGSASWVATVGDVLSWADGALTNGVTYWYQVAAVNVAGVGARSNEVSATPSAPTSAPSAPLSLKAQKVSDGIRLTWQAPGSDGGSPVTGYRVYRTGGAGNVMFPVSGSLLTMTDTTGLPRTWYAYVVSAVNDVGESPASNVVTVRTR